jgi:hypothetical protein
VTGIVYASGDALGYERSRTAFEGGAALKMDEAYRLAHLPLVAPLHPAVIARKTGTTYEMGRHAEMFSLVLPVPKPALQASPSFRALEAEIRAAPFAGKIAWEIAEARRDRLHATICGGLGERAPPTLAPSALTALRKLGPVHVQLRGLFSGNVNLGRLYLCAHPEHRNGKNIFQIIQRLLGRPETDLYVVGLWNFTDDLTVSETAALAQIIERWWDKPILTLSAESLWLLGAHDDLVLQSRIASEIPLLPA